MRRHNECILCIQTGKKVSDEDRMRMMAEQFFVKSEEQMRAHFPICHRGYLRITQKIADRC